MTTAWDQKECLKTIDAGVPRSKALAIHQLKELYNKDAAFKLKVDRAAARAVRENYLHAKELVANDPEKNKDVLVVLMTNQLDKIESVEEGTEYDGNDLVDFEKEFEKQFYSHITYESKKGTDKKVSEHLNSSAASTKHH